MVRGSSYLLPSVTKIMDTSTRHLETMSCQGGPLIWWNKRLGCCLSRVVCTTPINNVAFSHALPFHGSRQPGRRGVTKDDRRPRERSKLGNTSGVCNSQQKASISNRQQRNSIVVALVAVMLQCVKNDESILRVSVTKSIIIVDSYPLP